MRKLRIEGEVRPDTPELAALVSDPYIELNLAYMELRVLFQKLHKDFMLEVRYVNTLKERIERLESANANLRQTLLKTVGPNPTTVQ